MSQTCSVAVSRVAGCVTCHRVVVSENFAFIVTDHHRDDTVTRVVWDMVTWRKKARVRRRQNIPAASPAGVVDGSSVQPEHTV